MTKVFMLIAVAAFPLAVNASASDNGAAQHAKASHQQDGAATNPSIHEHCSCPADCPCRTEQQAPCDCGCEAKEHHQHD